MMITRNGLNRKIKDKDDFGIVFFGFKLAKVLKENNEFGKYINTLDIKMTATKSKGCCYCKNCKIYSL